MTDRIPHILNVDMLENMKKDAIQFGLAAVELYDDDETAIAIYMKNEFDSKYQPNWHCIAGRSFGSSVGHEMGCFIYFSVGKMCYLLFKSG